MCSSPEEAASSQSIRRHVGLSLASLAYGGTERHSSYNTVSYRRRQEAFSLLTWPDETRLSRMISTVDASNGFRSALMPIALSQASSASDALLHAILAVAAFHRYGSEAARPYKTAAFRLLSSSLEKDADTDSAGIVDAQLATSMMLCVYNVCILNQKQKTIECMTDSTGL